MLTGLSNKKIKISLPNFFKFAFLNDFFINLQETDKDVFNDNFEITSVEGCFPFSIWSLEREEKYAARHDIEHIIQQYSDMNIRINYIFDNECITKDDLFDNFSNFILKIAHKEGNGVYVKSKILYNYIKQNFPLYNLIKIVSEDGFAQKNIAISAKYNNQFDRQSIKYKKETYITLNPICSSECQKYDEHRIYFGKEQLNFYSLVNSYLCSIAGNTTFYDLKENPNFISFNKMAEYINDGFENFRIYYPSFTQSIDIKYNVYDAMESYLYYLIKPQMQREIRLIAIDVIERFQNEQV